MYGTKKRYCVPRTPMQMPSTLRLLPRVSNSNAHRLHANDRFPRLEIRWFQFSSMNQMKRPFYYSVIFTNPSIRLTRKHINFPANNRILPCSLCRVLRRCLSGFNPCKNYFTSSVSDCVNNRVKKLELTR